MCACVAAYTNINDHRCFAFCDVENWVVCVITSKPQKQQSGKTPTYKAFEWVCVCAFVHRTLVFYKLIIIESRSYFTWAAKRTILIPNFKYLNHFTLGFFMYIDSMVTSRIHMISQANVCMCALITILKLWSILCLLFVPGAGVHRRKSEKKCTKIIAVAGTATEWTISKIFSGFVLCVSFNRVFVHTLYGSHRFNLGIYTGRLAYILL